MKDEADASVIEKIEVKTKFEAADLLKQEFPEAASQNANPLYFRDEGARSFASPFSLRQ